MAEHLIQDTTLTGIADKIRSLLGLTGKMSPAQMQTNLTTEQANIAAALAALTEKGVEVPTGANSNALAGLIAGLEVGGGNINVPAEITHFAVDTFVLTSATQMITVGHSLGEIPYFAMIAQAKRSYTENATTYPYVFVTQLSIGAAQNSVKFSSGSEINGATPYADVSMTSTKRNSQTNHDKNAVVFGGASSGYFKEGEYIVITMRWET